MNATMEQTRTYTHNEQMDSLRRIVENDFATSTPQRALARIVWLSANDFPANDDSDKIRMNHKDDSFHRDAAALKGVPLATVYNRIRRILGLIK